MKKIGLLLFATALLITSCTDKNAFTLTGKVENSELNGKEVYLQKLNKEGTGFDSVDTAVIEKDQFIFKGKAGDTPDVRFVTIADPAQPMPHLFIVEPGKIDLTIDTVVTIKGTAMNDEYQKLSAKRDEINMKMKALGEEYRQLASTGELTPEQEANIQGRFEENVKELSSIIFEFTKTNMANPVGEFFFRNAGNAMDENQLMELLSLATPEFKQDEKIQLLEKQLTALKNTSIGQPFVDLKAKTPDDKDISLSDYAGKGKVVLIDFWASWCEPCLQEMPNVIEAYNKYKNKGFEIVGVSLDENADAWKNKIKELKMPWPQMSDLKGWESELSGAYGVTGIPHTVLLDKDGKIIEKNLRGEKLLSTLDGLLN